MKTRLEQTGCIDIKKEKAPLRWPQTIKGIGLIEERLTELFNQGKYTPQ